MKKILIISAIIIAVLLIILFLVKKKKVFLPTPNGEVDKAESILNNNVADPKVNVPKESYTTAVSDPLSINEKKALNKVATELYRSLVIKGEWEDSSIQAFIYLKTYEKNYVIAVYTKLPGNRSLKNDANNYKPYNSGFGTGNQSSFITLLKGALK
jgi:hypothetical protein